MSLVTISAFGYACDLGHQTYVGQDLGHVALAQHDDGDADALHGVDQLIGGLARGRYDYEVWSEGSDCRVLWLGPDEWLLTAGDAQREKFLRLPHAVDLSANRAVVEISGIDARVILAKGCTLDLRAGSFRAPRCAQTLIAKTQLERKIPSVTHAPPGEEAGGA